MKEAFLQDIWHHTKFNVLGLQTTCGSLLQVISQGTQNQAQGPDFINARLLIDGLEKTGYVEIHTKSSDWYVHKHETDKNYSQVILHVVWEDDLDIFDSNNLRIPTLELKNYISKKVLKNYLALESPPKKFINCENYLKQIDKSMFDNWIQKLLRNRLNEKQKRISKKLSKLDNDWEEVFFRLLCENFGLKVNGKTFLKMAETTPHKVVRKCQSQFQIEALFMGQSGLLEGDNKDVYCHSLESEYDFLKSKFKLNNSTAVSCYFFGLRPSNFPTIRLSQLADLYSRHQNLFSLIIESHSLKDFYKYLYSVSAPYWFNHYTFGKESKIHPKRLTKSFIDLLIINTCIPIRYAYGISLGKDVSEDCFRLLSEIPSEKNKIVNTFGKHHIKVDSAAKSQSLIELYNNYCSKNNCMNCDVGKYIVYKL